MERKNYTVAVDLGSSNVVVAVGEKAAEGQMEVASIVSKPVEGVNAGKIENIELVSRAIREAMSEAEEQLGIRITEAYAGISGDFVRCARHTDHVFVYDPQNGVNQKDVDALFDRMRNVQAPDDETIMERVPQNYVVDDNQEVKNPVGSFGKKLSSTFNFILCLRTPMQRLDMALKRLGIKMLGVTSNAIATAEAVLLPDEKEEGVAVVDIGGGTTDIAVLSLGGKVKATSVRVAGNHYDEEILKFVRNKFSIAIGQRTAENLKKNVACCPQKADFNETMEIKGRSLLTGLPVRVNVSTADLYEPVMRLSEQIGTAAHQVLEKTPPELAGDIYRNGVVLTGGGAQLHGLPEYLSQELKVEVTVSPDPVNCVALGTAMSLRLGDKLETGFMDATPRMGRR